MPHAHVKSSILWWPRGACRLCQPPSYDRSTRQQQNARRSCGARAKQCAYASSAGKTCLQAATGHVAMTCVVPSSLLPAGSGVLSRVCTCAGGRATCALHTLWDRFLAHLPDGAQPWGDVTPNSARDRLRRVLAWLGVRTPMSHRTHDLRRGHAEVRVRCDACETRSHATAWIRCAPGHA